MKFTNTDTVYKTDASNLWEIAKAYWNADRQAAMPDSEVPLSPISTEDLLNGGDAIYRLGHSSLLIKLGDRFVLTDPVFSQRASPVQWAGPKRFHEAPIQIEALPPIDAVVISHNHYDHLDKHAVLALQDKVTQFVTPLKVGEQVIKWGVDANKITELDWWQSTTVAGIELVATPAQHFSGRGLRDRDQTLWASWVIRSNQRNLFFSGDTGYFSGFAEIGEKYGPFDVTMMETGAYNPLWRDIHMMPEDTMQAHLDLGGDYLIPIHNGTFDLSLHDWYEPFERILALGETEGVNILTPQFGEPIWLDNITVSTRWWRSMLPETAEQSQIAYDADIIHN
nr:MBL fold metallo-hydrolase [Thaumasiovibrio subtropicus]